MGDVIVAAVRMGSVIGLGCRLIGNQSAADAAPIKVKQRVEGGKRDGGGVVRSAVASVE